VFISKLGEIKLGDFGVALTPGAARGLPGAFGKAHYLSPEQILGRTPTPRTDIFALGAVLFEVLTNARAFPGRDLKEERGLLVIPAAGTPITGAAVRELIDADRHGR